MSTLRSRLLVTFGVVLAAGLAALVFILWGFVRGRLDDDLDSQLRARTFALSRVVDSRRPRFQPYIEQGLDLKPEAYFAQLFDENGDLIDKSSNLNATLPLSEMTRRTAPDRTEPVFEQGTDAEGHRLRIATMTRYDFINGERQFQSYAQVGIRLDRHEQQLRQMAVGLASVSLAVWFIGMIVAALLIRHWLHSLASLKQAAGQLSLDKLAKQRVLVATADDEIAGLANTLNRLLDQLENAHTTQQRFVADASHELRTPLTILRGEIEVALRRPRSVEEYREVLQSNKEEIENLSRLTENLLLLARADAGQALTSQTDVDVSQVAREVCSKLLATAERRNVSVSCSADEYVTVRGDRLALERVLFNLIDNAISYSPPGDTVGVAIRSDAGQALIEITDAGPGIPPEHLPHLFDRFFRADQSRSREHEGAGLGLAIVKAFVEAHQGSVEVRSEIGHGTVFTVKLPLAG